MVFEVSVYLTYSSHIDTYCNGECLDAVSPTAQRQSGSGRATSEAGSPSRSGLCQNRRPHQPGSVHRAMGDNI
jgi:hypothetical protein